MASNSPMALDAGPVPLYFRLASDLRARIASKKLKPGDALPTEEQLCVEYAVSRITVRRAVDDLINERLVVRKRGVGTFVGTPSENTRTVSLIGSLYDALAYPKGISIKVLKREVVTAPAWVTKALQLGEKKSVYHCEVLSKLGKKPFGSTHFYFPLEIGEKIPFENMRGETPVAHLVEKVIGEAVVRAEQTVEPNVADADVSKLLGIPHNTPLLHVLRTYFSASGNPVEAVSVRYHPDQYQLKIELLPNKSALR